MLKGEEYGAMGLYNRKKMKLVKKVFPELWTHLRSKGRIGVNKAKNRRKIILLKWDPKDN